MAYLIGVLIALVAMFGLGIYNYLIKSFPERINKFSLSVVIQAIIGLLALIIVSMTSDFYIKNPENYVMLLMAGFFEAAAVLCALYAIEKGKLSVVVPVINSIPLFSVFFSFIFLNEVISLIGYIGIVIILLGVFLLSIREERIKNPITHSKKPFFLALAAAISLGLRYVFIKTPAQELGVFKSLLYLQAFTLIFLFIINIFLREKLVIPHKEEFKELSWLVLFYMFGVFGYLFAFNFAPVSIIVPITSASLVVTVFLALFILKEKLTEHQVIGVIATLIGIILITI